MRWHQFRNTCDMLPRKLQQNLHFNIMNDWSNIYFSYCQHNTSHSRNSISTMLFISSIYVTAIYEIYDLLLQTFNYARIIIEFFIIKNYLKIYFYINLLLGDRSEVLQSLYYHNQMICVMDRVSPTKDILNTE